MTISNLFHAFLSNCLQMRVFKKVYKIMFSVLCENMRLSQKVKKDCGNALGHGSLSENHYPLQAIA